MAREQTLDHFEFADTVLKGVEPSKYPGLIEL